jgi:enterochelin esterase-like enzyme
VIERRFLLVISAVVLALAVGASAASSAFSQPLPRGFSQFTRGPDGGTVWQGLVPNSEVPNARRTTVVYLPPNFSPRHKYPVVYLLQGFPGSPYQYVFGLQLAQRADQMIAVGQMPPFIAVIPPAGVQTRFKGEWTGIWEDYLVRDVVPWADAHLPTIARSRGRVLAGLSAGGYGAVDIGLRHPGLFGTVEAWSGSFTAVHDGSLAHANAAELAAHDPSLLVRREASLVRRLGIRFFLSCGKNDRVTAQGTKAFARELASLRIPYRLWLGPGSHNGSLWRAQLALALRYALRST